MTHHPRSSWTSVPLRVAVCGVAVAFAMGAGAWAQPYSEAPMLAEQVAAGTLPPVDERLPDDPLVEVPLESVGTYGGTWRQALRGGSDNLIERTVGYTRLARWNREWTDVIPDVAESFTVNDDATEFRFQLREGHRWSDGEPFTSADILFWYNDVLMNEALTPEVPSWLQSGGEPVVVEASGDHQVTFRFAEPNALFLSNMATVRGAAILAASPRHYLEQFHADYNDQADAMAQEAGAADWVQHFTTRVEYPHSRWRDADRPSLDAWVLTEPYDGTGQVVAERNPYYHKVDPEGQQLPYIDYVTFDVMESRQAIVLMAINGELDFQNRHIETADARPLIVQNQEQGNYDLWIAQPAWSNAMMINLNQTHKDPVLREIFSNRDFRVGLSHAINRDELNQIIYAGVAPPYQAAPRPGTELYDEEMATQYTAYDPALANEYLDHVVPERDQDGFRLRPDGERLSFAVNVLNSRQFQIDALELVRGYWADVGIEMFVRPLERSLSISLRQANDHDANVWIGGGGYDRLGLLDPKWYFPFEWQSSYAGAWGIWAQNPNDPNAEEPDETVLRALDLYRQVQATPDLEGQLDLMRQILAITEEQFYVIGTNMEPDRVGIVNADLRNVPDAMPNTYFYMTPGPAAAEQFYYVN